MREISSADNRIIKQAASLSEKKNRDALGLYLIEGPNFVRDALLYTTRARFIFMRAGSAAENLEIARLAEERGSAVYSLSDIAFSKLSDTKTTQGIIAACEKNTCTEEEFFKDQKSDILVLDCVQDPGNLGTMLRTAEAMGFAGVLLVKGCADPYAPKVVRAAAGSLMRLPLFTVSSSSECVNMLKRHGKRIFSAVMEGGTACYNACLKENAAIVIGNEGNGVSKALLDESEKLTIPMAGSIESLNAALAGGILMYEAYRQKISR